MDAAHLHRRDPRARRSPGAAAWFEIDAVEGGTRVRHVEELDLGHGVLGMLHDAVARSWFARSVEREVAEIGRLLEAGERGRPGAV